MDSPRNSSTSQTESTVIFGLYSPRLHPLLDLSHVDLATVPLRFRVLTHAFLKVSKTFRCISPERHIGGRGSSDLLGHDVEVDEWNILGHQRIPFRRYLTHLAPDRHNAIGGLAKSSGLRLPKASRIEAPRRSSMWS